jgi:hypothetical protein
MRLPTLLAAPVLLAAGACIPYATGTTARPAPQGEVIPSAAVYFIPGGVDRMSGDSVGGSYFGLDPEVRFGIDGRSDLGIRAPGVVGLTVNYKRRVDGNGELDGPALAYMVGAGVVNAGEHAHVEASLLASGSQGEGFWLTPYGGIKAMQVFPLVEDAVSDDPTVGVFAGVRIGTEALGISPEVAVFYDRSALGLRDRNVIIVPSFTFHGDQLVSRLFGGTDTRRYPPRRWP